MKPFNEPHIEHDGKEFEFLMFFGHGSIYGNGQDRLIVDPDGSVYGSYRADGRPKGVKLHVPVI